jgi:hypothetical protein
MQNQSSYIKNDPNNFNGQMNQTTVHPQFYSANPVVPPNTQLLSPHLAQVINEQYLTPHEIPTNLNGQTTPYVNQYPNTPNPQPTPRTDNDTRNIELRATTR